MKARARTMGTKGRTRGIILFDGTCGLCSAVVQFLLQRDPNGFFRFASQESEVGRQLIANSGAPADLSTVVLLEDEAVYVKSDAWFRIARRLTWPWPVFYAGLLVPRCVRDRIYDLVARHRHRIPSPRSCLNRTAFRGRFLDG
ncbi:MAG: DUF393 domain-containing protein [Deltaproteobacteria bacterium]|nr:DUF393 domain-containing protein [Deltaproteobacteria bacterium]